MEREENNVYIIPANYTDSGKWLGGLLTLRNTIETIVLLVGLGYIEVALIPMSQIVRSSIMDYEPIVSLNEFREMVRREQEEREKKKAPKPKKAQPQGIYADLPLDDV